jgi:glycosyltransferase involved in cell wall biosynthesis
MISIIIPTRNEEKGIEQILSTLKNTLTIPHEIIVSDGNSTDATVAIVQKYADKIVLQDKQRPKTIGTGRNQGAEAASGEYLVFLDADCTIPNPDAFFGRALNYFESHPKIVGLCAKIKVLPKCSTWMDKIVFGCVNETYAFFNNVLRIGAASGEFMMIKKTAFVKVGGFKERLAASEDINLFYTVSRIGRTHLLRSLVVLHTGRRAHAIGWPLLLSEWFANTISLIFRHKAATDEWKVIR